MEHRRAAYWVFADQGVVSGCNFLVSALMARFLGVADFGQWILVFGVVLYVNTIAGALIWLPMLTLTPRMTDLDARRGFLLGSLACQVGLAAVAALVVGAGGLLIAWLEPQWLSVNGLIGLVAVCGFFQLQDWVRRYCFSCAMPKPALLLDLLAYGGQVLVLLMLQWVGMLSLPTALAAVAACYGLSFLVGLGALGLRPDWRQAPLVFSELWRVGKAYLFGEQMQWVGTAGLLYAAAHVLGAQASGAVRAVQSLLGPTTMLFQASNNLVLPRCAMALQQGGPPALSKYLFGVMVQFGLPLFLGLAIVSWFGSEVMTLAFGRAYGAYGGLVGVQALQVLLTFVWLLAMYRARTLDRVDLIMRAGAIQALLSLVAAWALAPFMQETGVVLASALGLMAALLVLLKC